MQEKDLINLAKDFNREELYLLLNAVSIRSIDIQRDLWNCKTEQEAKYCRDMIVCFNALAEKIRYKVDAYAKKDN